MTRKCIALDDIIVCIPIYRNELSPSEELSLKQVRAVLCRYNICFIAPNDFDVHNVAYIQDIPVIKFPRVHFKSVVSYSKLLLSCEFYKKFTNYQYMLIYQLDAFVFKDELLDFCNMGYDYIGAPWPVWCLKVQYRVGNGGLSLRNIQSCINVLKNKEKIYTETGLKTVFECAEDVFFAFCGGKKDIKFTVPTRKIASSFSVEADIKRYVNKDVMTIVAELPFGCHKWSAEPYYSFWRNVFIAVLGNKWDYRIDDELKGSYRGSYHDIYLKLRKQYIFEFFKERFFKYCRCKQRFMTTKWPLHKDVIVWGYGLVGQKAVLLLERLGINIKNIYDKSAGNHIAGKDARLSRPNIDVLKMKKYFVIIATSRYKGEIILELKKMGYHVDEYAYIGDFEQSIFYPYIEFMGKCIMH